MKCIDNVSDLQRHLVDARRGGTSIGLVPTMGNLHQGHLSLVRAALDQTGHVVATSFVNPLQFGPDEDFQTYPRTPEQDRAALKELGCHCLFAPPVEEMFGTDLAASTAVHVPIVSEEFEGRSRPGHFDGVATVVCKLLNQVRPDKAFFGLKDYQQFLVIRKLVADLSMGPEIIGIETVRETDGLALSSRNNYLSADERRKAPTLYRCLKEIEQAICSGRRDFEALEKQALAQLEEAGFESDYIAICTPDTLQAASGEENELAILGAARLGPTRLLDNIRLRLDS